MERDKPLSLGSLISGLMFVIGLVTGPGYYFYCTWYSGKNAGEYAIQPERNGFAPVALRLDPDMNPIAVAISAHVSGSASDQLAWIGMALDDGPTRLISGTANFSADKDGTSVRHTVVFGQFSVPRADRYTVHLNGTMGETFGVRLTEARLQVRRNVREPHMKVVWWGVGILVASFLVNMLSGDGGVYRNRD